MSKHRIAMPHFGQAFNSEPMDGAPHWRPAQHGSFVVPSERHNKLDIWLCMHSMARRCFCAPCFELLPQPARWALLCRLPHVDQRLQLCKGMFGLKKNHKLYFMYLLCRWNGGAAACSTAPAAEGLSSIHGAAADVHESSDAIMDRQIREQAKASLSKQLDVMATFAHKWEGASEEDRSEMSAELERLTPQWRSLSTFLHQGESELADEFIRQYSRLERLRLLQSRRQDLPRRGRQFEDAGDAYRDAVPKHPYMSNVVYDSHYYTEESNPLQHTAEHDGKYFVLDKECNLEKLMPEGPPGDLGKEFYLSGHTALMVRPHMRQLVAQLEAFKNADAATLAAVSTAACEWPVSASASAAANQTPCIPAAYNTAADLPLDAGTVVEGDQRGVSSGDLPFQLLSAPRGMGKSAAMQYALYYARQNGWITLYIPDAWRWMRQSLYQVPSSSRPGWADQPDLALEMLQHVASVNLTLLRDVPQRGQYSRDRYLPQEQDEVVMGDKSAMRQAEDAEKARLKASAEAAGTQWDRTSFQSGLPELLDSSKVDRSAYTLGDMVEWGIRHPPFATDCLLDLFAELKQSDEHPILFAVDGVNWFYEESDVSLFGEPIPTERISLASLGRVMGPNGLQKDSAFKRAYTLVADSYKHTFSARMYDEVRHPRGTRRMLQPLDRTALHNQLLHYHFSGNFVEVSKREDIDSHAVDYFHTMTAGNPREVLRAAGVVLDQQETKLGQRKRHRL